MTVPLIILTIITLTIGWCLPGSFGSYISATGTPYHIHLNWEVAGTSIAIALCAIVLATWMYARSTQPVADKLQATLPQLNVISFISTSISIISSIFIPFAMRATKMISPFTSRTGYFIPINFYFGNRTIFIIAFNYAPIRGFYFHKPFSRIFSTSIVQDS